MSETSTTPTPAATGAPQATTTDFRLAVLNPDGRDASISYANGPGKPGDPGHAPINYHAYAAATKGDFLDKTSAALDADHDAVLVLIRRRARPTLDAVRKLKEAGRTVLISWKESGPYQITRQLGTRRALEDYQELLNLTDGVLSPTTVLPPRWGWISAEEFDRKTRFIPTPYPLEFEDWNFHHPIEDRKGIFVGTREFFAPTRNHLLTLAETATLSAELRLPVTVINSDKRAGRKMLAHLEESFPEASLHIIDRPLPYPEYLATMARHRLVFHLDRSAVPGQVAGDALLCRNLCAGGNSAVEELAYPELADHQDGSPAPLRNRLRRLLSDSTAYTAAVESARQLAAASLSYSAVAQQLAEFIRDLQSPASKR